MTRMTISSILPSRPVQLMLPRSSTKKSRYDRQLELLHEVKSLSSLVVQPITKDLRLQRQPKTSWRRLLTLRSGCLSAGVWINSSRLFNRTPKGTKRHRPGSCRGSMWQVHKSTWETTLSSSGRASTTVSKWTRAMLQSMTTTRGSSRSNII